MPHLFYAALALPKQVLKYLFHVIHYDLDRVLCHFFKIYRHLHAEQHGRSRITLRLQLRQNDVDSYCFGSALLSVLEQYRRLLSANQKCCQRIACASPYTLSQKPRMISLLIMKRKGIHPME
jgi:hypothetical protein